MNTTKVTLSINSNIYKDFKKINLYKGLSISAWVTTLMQKEVEDYKQDMICKLASGIEIAKAMYAAGMRLDIIKEKLELIFEESHINEIMKNIE